MNCNNRFRPGLEALETREVPANIRIVGTQIGPPHVQVFGGDDSRVIASFYAFDPAFQGGVSVGIGDVNADGVDDYICGAGEGGRGHVIVVDGTKANQTQSNGQIADSALLASFISFAAFQGGLFVTGGQFDGDRFAEVAVGTGQGAAGQVRVFDVAGGRATQMAGPIGDFLPYGAGFLGGITLGAADVNRDGRDELVTGTFRGSSHLKTFDANTGNAVLSQFAFEGFNGGFSISTFDVNNDGFDDVVTGGAEGAGGHVKIFSGRTGQVISSFFGMGDDFTGGTRVAISATVRGTSVWAGPNPARGAVINSSNPFTGSIVDQVTPFGAEFQGGLFLANGRTGVAITATAR